LDIRAIDVSVLIFVNKTLRLGVLDPIMVFITNRGYILALFVVIGLIFKDKKSALIASALGLASVLLTDWVSHIIKHMVERPRPFYELPELDVLTGRGRSFSMPSNHASNAFAFILPFYFFVRSRLRHLLLFIAVLIAYSRLYVGVHYPSDVIVGAGLGSALSILVVIYYKAVSKIERDKRILVFVLTALSIFRVYYITEGPLDLSPDEAHYWDWSRRLDISYYSKGPVIAYLIWSGTKIFGDSVFGVRGFAILFSLLSSLILYLLGKTMYDEKTGIYSALIYQIVPIFAAFGIGMSIDSPFLFFWTLSLLLFYLAVRDNSIKDWIALGVTIGLGLLTKYLMAFFYLSGLLYILSIKEKRRLLLSPAPYLTTIISILLFSPVIIWNWEHDWVTLRHTLGQTHLSEGAVFSAKSFFEFIGSQFGVISPVLFIFIIYIVVRLRKENPFVFWFSVPMLVFFLLKSIQGKVQANWPMTAYVVGVIGFSAYIRDFSSFRGLKKAAVISAIVISLGMTSIGHFPSLINLPPKKDPSARLRGWRSLGTEISSIRKQMKKETFIFSDSYQVTAELAFYTEGKPFVYCINLGRRMNQYDIWPGFEGLVGYDAIFVKMGRHELPTELKDLFEGYERHIFEAEDKKGKKIREFSIFILRNFKGMERKYAESF